jgi:hypothetical protein
MNHSHVCKHKPLSKIEWLFLLFVIGISCSGLLQNYVHPDFSYIDDVFAVFILVLYIGKSFFTRKTYLNKNEKFSVKLWLILFIAGISGNLLSNYQTIFFAISVDILAWSKLFVVFPCMGVLINYENGNRYYEVVIKYVKLLTVLIFTLVILNLIFHLKLVDSKYDRFGIPAFTFGAHPTFTVALSCGFLSLLLLDYKKNVVWIVLCCIIAMATLRFKAFAYISFILMMIYFVNNKIKIKRRYLIITSILCIILVYDQISYYFFNPEAGRAFPLWKSLDIAKVFFPIGSGFATFGTATSGQYYSKAYDIYGLSDSWGFSPDAYTFIGDGGWATVIGQFGIIGFILTIYMIFLIYKSIAIYKPVNMNLLPVLSIFSYLLIASTSELSIASNYSILYAYCLTVIVNKYKYEKYKSPSTISL